MINNTINNNNVGDYNMNNNNMNCTYITKIQDSLI